MNCGSSRRWAFPPTFWWSATSSTARGRTVSRQKRRICGRGSGAASLVAYCLEITNVCPISYNLYFERFLNPGRTDPPDIDIDFAWDERDEVLARRPAATSTATRRWSATISASSRGWPSAKPPRSSACRSYEISRLTKRMPWLSHGGGEGSAAAAWQSLPSLADQDLSAALAGDPRACRRG